MPRIDHLATGEIIAQTIMHRLGQHLDVAHQTGAAIADQIGIDIPKILHAAARQAGAAEKGRPERTQTPLAYQRAAARATISTATRAAHLAPGIPTANNRY